MPELEPQDDILIPPLARMLFGSGEDLDEATADRAAKVLGLVGPVYQAQVGRIRNRVEENALSGEAGAIQALYYGLTEALAARAGITTPDARRDLLEMLRGKRGPSIERKFAAARGLAGVASSEDDEAAVETLVKFAQNPPPDPAQPPVAEKKPSRKDPKMAQNPQDIIARIMNRMAFDEARLPARLHYDTDNDGNDVPSAGQVNFLNGVGMALQKLGAEADAPAAGIAAVASILLLDGHYDPDDRAFYDQVRASYTELLEPASAKRDELIAGNDAFEANFRLKAHVFKAVVDVLKPENDADGEKVFFHAVGAVYRGMVAKYDTRPPGSAGFASAARALYNEETLASGGSGGGGSGIAFLDLPPLSDPSGGTEQIVPENIRAISAIYMVYQCEQMLLFDVVDRIVELFMAGLLPMGGDALARRLDTYYWNGDDRVSKAGRSSHATRALGAPGGDVGPDVTANTEFNPSLMHVISSLAEFERQRNVGNLFEQNRRYAVATTGEYVRKAIRDLAANCTLYGYAGAQFAAERMGRQLSEAIEILKLPRIQEIYGVSSMWQVIERVAQSEFGTTVNVVKHRTLAQETRAILDTVAQRHQVWSLSSDRPLFTTSDDVPGDLSRAETDRLFRAAQYFLAVNGVQNDQVHEYSQPTDTPALPSIPGMGAFGGGGGMPAMGAGGGGGADVAGQLKSMLDKGQTPSPEQIRAMVGF